MLIITHRLHRACTQQCCMQCWFGALLLWHLLKNPSRLGQYHSRGGNLRELADGSKPREPLASGHVDTGKKCRSLSSAWCVGTVTIRHRSHLLSTMHCQIANIGPQGVCRRIGRSRPSTKLRCGFVRKALKASSLLFFDYFSPFYFYAGCGQPFSYAFAHATKT